MGGGGELTGKFAEMAEVSLSGLFCFAFRVILVKHRESMYACSYVHGRVIVTDCTGSAEGPASVRRGR